MRKSVCAHKKIDRQAKKKRFGVDGHKYLSAVSKYAFKYEKVVYISWKPWVKYGGRMEPSQCTNVDDRWQVHDETF